MKRPVAVSRVEMSPTPANGLGEEGVAAGAGVVGTGCGPGVTPLGVEEGSSSAPMSVVPMLRGSPSMSSRPLAGSSAPASIVGEPAAAW